MTIFYDQARDALRQAKEHYEELLAEFSDCTLDYASAESQSFVRELYDTLIGSVKVLQVSALGPAEFRSALATLEADWLTYSAARFGAQCLELAQAFLAYAGRQKPDALVSAEARKIFVEKNARYGNTFLKTGVPGIFVRLSDKVGRLAALTSPDSDGGGDESVYDTAIDAANYCIMCAIAHSLAKSSNLPVR